MTVPCANGYNSRCHSQLHSLSARRGWNYRESGICGKKNLTERFLTFLKDPQSSADKNAVTSVFLSNNKYRFRGIYHET